MTESRGNDRVLFAAAAVGLFAMAGVFGWRELGLGWQPVVLAMAVVAGALAVLGRGLVGGAGSWVLLATTVVGAAGYVATRSDELLAGLVAAAIASGAAATARAQRPDGARGETGERRALWASVVVGALAASWALYFRLFTIGFAEETVARRLVLTLGWLAAGVVTVVLARDGAGERRGVREAGYVFVLAAIAKVVAYDTTHLHGALRIAALAGSGTLLAVGAALVGRARRPSSAVERA